ncbi:MAG: heme-binding protein [Hyphomicrobiales bacterium]|nr:heme-binding protein [Hyphomicrobiales bacterium]MBV8440090.1 heme-binding protein [Hyphomicrobiales bacterium]
MPVRVGGIVVGAVGVSGLVTGNDIKIADAAAAGVK